MDKTVGKTLGKAVRVGASDVVDEKIVGKNVGTLVGISPIVGLLDGDKAGLGARDGAQEETKIDGVKEVIDTGAPDGVTVGVSDDDEVPNGCCEMSLATVGENEEAGAVAWEGSTEGA